MADRKWNRGAYHGKAAKPKNQPAAGDGEQGQVLASIPRGQSEELRISIRAYEGRPYLSFQVWAAGDDGEFQPVKWKSSTVRIRELGQVIGALKQAERLLGSGQAAGSATRSGSKGKAGRVESSSTLFGDDDGPASAAPRTEWVQLSEDFEAF